MLRSLSLLSLLFCTAAAWGQAAFVPLGHNTYHLIDRFDIKYGKVIEPYVHTGYKPYSRKEVAELAESIIDNNITGNKRFNYNVRNLLWDNEEWTSDTLIASKKAVFNTFYRKPASLYSVETDDFVLKINPALQFELGGQPGSDGLRFKNSRGVEVRGSIKKKLSFYTFLTDNQARGMDYVQQHIKDESAVPGNGYYKDFRTTGVDYFTARGYIIFNVLDHIDVQVGHDKNFIGNGYRSLFLSDYGNSYFFMKLQTTVWRITYTNLFTEMTATYNRGGDRLLPKKYGAFHHLNINIAKGVDLGFFEGVIYERDRGFELQYLNPIIFYRAVEQALGSPDNSIVGADFKINLFRAIQLYGQVMFDEFNFAHLKARDGWWANKFGLQAGVKYIDAFTVKNLDLQAEFNFVRPFTYTHNTTATTYTHYNQPLAHPLGANFWELVTIARYQVLPELWVTGTFIYYQKGLDDVGENWGGNIFLSNVDDNGQLTTEREFGNKMVQGKRSNVALFDLLVSYQARHNLFCDLNLIYRNASGDLPAYVSSQFYVGFGVRLNMVFQAQHY